AKAGAGKARNTNKVASTTARRRGIPVGLPGLCNRKTTGAPGSEAAPRLPSRQGAAGPCRAKRRALRPGPRPVSAQAEWNVQVSEVVAVVADRHRRARVELPEVVDAPVAVEVGAGLERVGAFLDLPEVEQA